MSASDGVGAGIVVTIAAIAIAVLSFLTGRDSAKVDIQKYGCEAFMKAEMTAGK